MLFDFQYSASTGTSSTTIRQTVFARKGQERIPAFELRPESVGHKIASALGFHDIDFERRPEFSGRFLLRGDDESAIRRLFDDAKLRFFEKGPKRSVECDGEWIVTYRDGHDRAADELRSFVEDGEKIAAMFFG